MRHLVLFTLLGSPALFAGTIATCSGGAVVSSSLAISCGGLSIDGFTNTYIQPFASPDSTPTVANGSLQLLSASYQTGPSGAFVDLVFHGSSSALGLVGVNFTLGGWQGAFVNMVSPNPSSQGYAEVNFCRQGHDAFGPTNQVGAGTFAWVGCYDGSGTKYSSLGHGVVFCCPVEAADSAGIVDVSTSQLASGAASFPSSLTARIVTFAGASGGPDFEVQISAPTPEPSPGWAIGSILGLACLVRHRLRWQSKPSGRGLK
jgi:hypothetical protein